MSAPPGAGAHPPSLLWVNHFAISPGEGGGTRHFELGRELVRRGWQVRIAASDLNLLTRRYSRREGPKDREAVSEWMDGVEFRWLWAAPYERNDWRRVWNWLSFSRSLLRDGSADHRPDVVIGSSPHLFAAWAGLRLARRLDVPFVLEVRDLWPETLAAVGGWGGIAYRTLDRLARHLYRNASRIVVLARGTGLYLEEQLGVPAERLLYVPNGIDPAAFNVSAPLRNDAFTVVYAGAHGPANGLDAVVEAAVLLRDRREIRFLLVGDGPARPVLRERAAALGLENVEFRPPVPKREMPALLAGADAGLMVLRDTDLFSFGVSPNKLFDYMGAALPVICNVRGEVAEIVRAASAGEQAVDASPAALAAAVLQLAGKSPESRARMGEEARRWVAREHGRDVVAERLDAALHQLVS